MRTTAEHNARLIARARQEADNSRQRKRQKGLAYLPARDADDEPEAIEDQDALLESLDRQDIGR